MTQQVRKGYRNHRKGTWAAVLVVLIAAALVVLVPAGSAKAPTSEVKKYDACLQYNGAPLCSTSGRTSLPGGGSSVLLSLTITNEKTSNQALGSVNLTLPSGSAIQIDTTKNVIVTPAGNANPNPPTSSTIQIRNLSLAPNSSATVSFWVNTDCSGSTGLSWTIAAKQSNTFLGTGNDFTLANSTGLTTDLQGCSYIDFVPGAQPTKTVVGATITGSEYSSGGPVQVGLYSNVTHALLSSCPALSGNITLSKNLSIGTLHGTLSQALTGSSGSCVASFNDLWIGDLGGSGQPTLPQSFQLLASGMGSSATSSSFSIINGTICTSGQSCSTTFTTQSTSSTSSQTSGNFVFIGMESALDLLGTRIPAGCAGFQTVGADPIIISEQRTSASGEIFVTYGIKKTLIQKKYGSNSGQQFIPICAGAKRLAVVNGKTKAIPCSVGYPGTDQPQTGWIGKQLDSDGKFTGSLGQAVCDEQTGYFFGIMGSFQDYTNSDPTRVIDPNTSPTVVEWSSDTTYRYFTSRWPSASGTGFFATDVPWDGYKFG